MKNIVFLIHGMGMNDADWWKPIETQLRAKASGFAPFRADAALFDTATYIGIEYDSIFAPYRERCAQSAPLLKSMLQAKGGSISEADIDRLTGWLQGASPTASNFFWTHVTDVLFYRFLPEVQRQVRLKVITAITEALNEAQADGSEVDAHVLAHSLGTSVAHDVLAMLATGNLGSPVYQQFRWADLFMIANVSRVLETQWKVYDSKVRPLSDGDSVDSVVNRFWNFNHAWDPIPAVKRFDPPDWGEFFVSGLALDHFHALNVHALDHYLDHPLVHGNVLNGIYGMPILKSDLEAAAASYPRLDPSVAAKVDAFKQQVTALLNASGGLASAEDFLTFAAQYGTLI